MKFDVEVVLECLKINGEVFTVRSFSSKNKFSVVQVNNVGDCIKEKICKVESINDLIGYSHLSGFNSPLEWWNKIVEFGAQNGWLYRVSILDDEEGL